MKTTLARCLRFTVLSVLFVAVLFSAIWAGLALLLAGIFTSAVIAKCVAVVYAVLALITLVLFVLKRRRWTALSIYGLAFTGVLFGWQGLMPSNERDWQTDVAVLPTATIEGDQVLVKNIRNFSYKSEFDYIPAYYDKTFDLNKLEGVDMVTVYWMGPQIAHIFLSFAFSDGKHLAISIETRKEKGEGYSTLKGFFRQYELYYVVADERDVIRLRTNYRHDPPEDVYVYRLKGPLENTRNLFLEYLRQINDLAVKPAFYNSLTTNCTTTIWLNTRVNATHLPFHWSMIANGYLPQYLYQSGRIEKKGLTFEDLQKNVHANARAQTADQAADFSKRIRN
jgi:hypothetical protein